MATRTFEQLLEKYPSDVQNLARRARTLILQSLPAAEESVDSNGPYITYGYGPGYKGVVCYLTVSKTEVKLGCANGAELADPNRLLKGKGKSHRHVPLKSPSDLRKPGLKQLVRASLAAWKKRMGQK